MPDEGRLPSERLLDLGQGLALWRVHVDDLIEQPVNAQAMTPAMFARLKSTIGRDARLESLPLSALLDTDGVQRIEIVSGHHRVRASRAAEVFYVHTVVDETGLSADHIRAKMLAHNAIAGTSEQQLVDRIYAAITDVDLKLESFVEPSDAALAPVRLPRLNIDLGYRSILLVFLPHAADAFDAAVDQLHDDGVLAADASKLYLVDKDLDEWWRAACRRMGKEHDARSVTTQVARLVDAAMTHLGLADGEDPDPDEWVPLSELLGSALVPPDAAEVIGRAVAGMTKAGRAAPKRGWQAIAELAADYNDGRGDGWP